MRIIALKVNFTAPSINKTIISPIFTLTDPIGQLKFFAPTSGTFFFFSSGQEAITFGAFFIFSNQNINGPIIFI